MKPYLVIFNKEITDTDKLFGFQIMSHAQMQNYIKSLKKLENDGFEFEINGELYEYVISDFEIQPITSQEVKLLSKIFEFDYDPASGESPIIGIIPNAIEQCYYEYPDDSNDENYKLDDDINDEYNNY